MAEFRRRPADASAADLDVRVTEAFRADALAQMSAMASSVAESLREPGTVCRRSASMLSCGGRVPFRHPYAPKRGVSVKALAKFGCEDGKSRTTPEARRIVAESGAQLDSFQDAQTFLKENLRPDVSVSTMMAIARDAAEKTRAAWTADTLVENARILSVRKLPRDAREVGVTMAVLVDGTGAPCTRADTEGVRGKDGDEAGTREVKVVAIALYGHVDRNGRPTVRRGDVWYFASACSSDELESVMNMLARRRGIGKIQRVQFIGDGAAWIQKIWARLQGMRRDTDAGLRPRLQLPSCASRNAFRSGRMRGGLQAVQGHPQEMGRQVAHEEPRQEVRGRARSRRRRRGEGTRLPEGAGLDDGLRVVAEERLLHRIWHDRIGLQDARCCAMQARGNALAAQERGWHRAPEGDSPIKLQDCGMSRNPDLTLFIHTPSSRTPRTTIPQGPRS